VPYYLLAVLLFVELCVAKDTSKDSVFVQETDSSYTLYYQTNGSLRKIYEISWSNEDGGSDGSNIRYVDRYKDNVLDYDLISLNNNGCDCSQYIFFDRKTKIAYFTKNFYQGFIVEKQSVNFKDRNAILYSYKSAKSTTEVSSLSIINNSSDGNAIWVNDFFGKRVLEGIFPIHEGKKDEDIFLYFSKGKD